MLKIYLRPLYIQVPSMIKTLLLALLLSSTTTFTAFGSNKAFKDFLDLVVPQLKRVSIIDTPQSADILRETLPKMTKVEGIKVSFETKLSPWLRGAIGSLPKLKELSLDTDNRTQRLHPVIEPILKEILNQDRRMSYLELPYTLEHDVAGFSEFLRKVPRQDQLVVDLSKLSMFSKYNVEGILSKTGMFIQYSDNISIPYPIES
jgi:hypothetical protein